MNCITELINFMKEGNLCFILVIVSDFSVLLYLMTLCFGVLDCDWSELCYYLITHSSSSTVTLHPNPTLTSTFNINIPKILDFDSFDQICTVTVFR